MIPQTSMERHTALLKDSSLCRPLSRLDISLGKGALFKIRTVRLPLAARYGCFAKWRPINNRDESVIVACFLHGRQAQKLYKVLTALDFLLQQQILMPCWPLPLALHARCIKQLTAPGWRLLDHFSKVLRVELREPTILSNPRP